MKLDKEGKLTEPNVGDAELVRFDFDHAGISMHLRLAASEGAIFVLRIVNARWFSFSTDSSQYVIDRIVITENLYEAAAAAPHYAFRPPLVQRCRALQITLPPHERCERNRSP